MKTLGGGDQKPSPSNEGTGKEKTNFFFGSETKKFYENFFVTSRIF